MLDLKPWTLYPQRVIYWLHRWGQTWLSDAHSQAEKMTSREKLGYFCLFKFKHKNRNVGDKILRFSSEFAVVYSTNLKFMDLVEESFCFVPRVPRVPLSPRDQCPLSEFFLNWRYCYCTKKLPHFSTRSDQLLYNKMSTNKFSGEMRSHFFFLDGDAAARLQLSQHLLSSNVTWYGTDANMHI